MKQLYTLLSIVFLLTSCTDPALKKVQEMSKTCQKAEVYFFYENGENEEDTIKQPLTKASARRFIKNISRKSAPDYDCGSDGMVRLYNSNKEALAIHFKLNNSCSHAFFKINGYAYSKAIEQEGITQLQAYKAKASIK